MLQFLLAIVIGLLVLGVLVFVHELGHFTAAKLCKIRVHAFAVGFGKPIIKWKSKDGETEYRINSIPFGGYVAMTPSESPVGETAGGDNEFNKHPIWKRATVAVAGPLANFVFAVLTLWSAFIIGIDRPAFMDSTKVGVVIQNSPADIAGFKAGDSIIAIDSEAVNSWEQLLVRLQESGTMAVRVLRDGEPVELDLHVETRGARFAEHPTGGLMPKRYPPVIGSVVPHGPADIAGLQVGDTIRSIYGTDVESFDHFSIIMRDYVSGTGLVNIDVIRGGKLLSLLVPPTYDSTVSRYLIGVSPIPEPTIFHRYSVVGAFAPAMEKSLEYTRMIFDVLGKLTSGKVDANQLAGPLNIIPISGMMAFQGLSSILDFMALIGINLAILNLMPLVITDGGLLVFLLIEAARGKPLPAHAQAAINKVFIMLFIALFLFVSFNDIQRLPDFFRWGRP